MNSFHYSKMKVTIWRK